MKSVIVLALLLALVIADELPLLPYPQSETHGADSSVVSLSKSTFACPSTASKIVNDACARMVKRIFPFGEAKSAYPSGVYLSTISIQCNDWDDSAASLQHNISESYKLTVQSNGNAAIVADTVWGALHAMNLVNYTCEYKTCKYFIPKVPIVVSDWSRFPWRGILVDSSRHYLPLYTLQQMIDAMAAVKFNVMHWHLVDAIAIPIKSDKFPELVKASYATDAAYNMQEIAGIIDYAYRRGVRVMLEFDMPGHAYAWGKGYPITANCPGYTKNINNVALDPTNQQTYNVVGGVMQEAFAFSKEHYVHLGGDEIVYACWGQDQNIVQFMKDKGFTTYQQLENYYFSKIYPTLTSNNKSPVFWQEVFQAGVSFPADTMIQVWIDGPTLAKVVRAGRKAISSYAWYIDLVPPGTDHRQWITTWKEWYAFDPVNSLANENLTPEQKALVAGGEACMWGEEVDEFSLLERVWPKTNAIAERLWSSEKMTDVASMTARMVYTRCHVFVQQMGLPIGAMAPDFCRRP